MNRETTWREKGASLYEVAAYRPWTSAAVVLLSLVAAAFEGIGLSFIAPILEQLTADGGGAGGGSFALFRRLYAFVGVPFTLEFLLAGAMLAIGIRFVSSFLVEWFRAALRTDYVRHLKTQLYSNAIDARIRYLQQWGSDDVLNAVVTQTSYGGRTIESLVTSVQRAAMCAVYLAIALYLAPVLTVVTVVVLGGILFGFRRILESGYIVGNRVATSNERMQSAAQAGIQGLAETKLFGIGDELRAEFQAAVDTFTSSMVRLKRNESALKNLYHLVTAIAVFWLIYAAVSYASLSLGSAGVFLFAMFRLGPMLSKLSKRVYKVEGDLPHLVRTQRMTRRLRDEAEPTADDPSQLPERVTRTAFENVSFAYDDGDPAIRDLSFAVERGEFVAVVGPSGAGKSTIVSLLARFYPPDEGRVTADGVDVRGLPLEKWRERIAIVRQDPHIFDETLRYNVTLGNRDATAAEIREICEIAEVTEFLDELPEGFDTVLGDDGVRLSGGQKQRVAIARALLKDADVLVLDEATSALDSQLEERVQRNIEAMGTDYAMIVIAHRLSTVVNADRIYTMVDGRVTEIGDHEELLTNEGKYAELYALQ